jgi:hypothetical protein
VLHGELRVACCDAKTLAPYVAAAACCPQVCNGLVLASDGKKMSKRLKNYPVRVTHCIPWLAQELGSMGAASHHHHHLYTSSSGRPVGCICCMRAINTATYHKASKKYVHIVESYCPQWAPPPDVEVVCMLHAGRAVHSGSVLASRHRVLTL